MPTVSITALLGLQLPKSILGLPVDDLVDFYYSSLLKLPFQPALSTASQDYESDEDYSSVAYLKGSSWMYLLERALGKEKVDNAFKTYFRNWKTKHPQPLDMKASFEEAINGKLNQFFGLLNKTGSLEE